MPVTLSHVARRAGVSKATASRVLNRHRAVSATSRARVEAAVSELRYVPNRAARNLSLARTSTVAFLVHHAQYPARGEASFGQRVLHGAMLALRGRGYDLVYAVADDHDVERLASLPATGPGRSDGVLLLGPAFPSAAVRALYDTGRPLVLIDNRLADAPVPAVLADNLPAAASMTRHLVAEHGYRRVACIAGPEHWPSTAERVAGYRGVLLEAGLTPRVVHAAETTVRDGAQAYATLEDDPPDAVVAVNDAMAIGALNRIRADGRRLRPAIVGFDDTWAPLTDPPLSTVTIDAGAMGRQAAVRLLELIEGAGSGLREPSEDRIRATVNIRESCGMHGSAARHQIADSHEPAATGASQTGR